MVRTFFDIIRQYGVSNKISISCDTCAHVCVQGRKKGRVTQTQLPDMTWWGLTVYSSHVLYLTYKSLMLTVIL